MKPVFHISLAMLLSAGTVLAQETLDFDRYDTNNDGYLDDEEWSRVDGFDADIESLDANGDDALSQQEITESLNVEIVSRSGPGADLAPREVTAEDQDSVASGSAGRNADDRDRQSGAAVSGEAQEAGPGVRDAAAGQQTRDEGLQAFRETDADGDGRVSAREAEQSGDRYVVIYFNALDSDGDGYLRESEWEQDQGGQAVPGVRDTAADTESLVEEPEVPVGAGSRDAVPAGTIPVSEDEEGGVAFEEDFGTYDINQDGYIDREEGESGMLDTDVFEQTDIDGDGRIDSEEAAQGMRLGDEEDDEPVTEEDY